MFALREKFRLYRELLQDQQERASGFIEFHECDSLLFSGLVGCVPGVNVKIEEAQNSNGRWFRKPWYLGKCYEPNSRLNRRTFAERFKEAYSIYKASKNIGIALETMLNKGSTISRDMLLGLAYYAFYNKRLDLSESVINYALEHWGFMGEGNLSRINIMPSLFSTFCWISYKLGGPSRAWARWIPVASGGKLQGYQAHLQVLHILLREELTGKLSEKAELTLRYHRHREPMNPLFRIAVGDDLTAVSILSDEHFWPSERLPTELDRKSQWLPERDYSDDWFGIKGEGKGYKAKVHSGGDFLFCYWLIFKDSKRNVF